MSLPRSRALLIHSRHLYVCVASPAPEPFPQVPRLKDQCWPCLIIFTYQLVLYACLKYLTVQRTNKSTGALEAPKQLMHGPENAHINWLNIHNTIYASLTRSRAFISFIHSLYYEHSILNDVYIKTLIQKLKTFVHITNINICTCIQHIKESPLNC